MKIFISFKFRTGHPYSRRSLNRKPTICASAWCTTVSFSLLWKNLRIKRLPCSTLTPSFRELWYKNFLNVSHFVAALNIRYIHYPWKLVHQNYKFKKWNQIWNFFETQDLDKTIWDTVKHSKISNTYLTNGQPVFIAFL